jgi:hypothetical protein
MSPLFEGRATKERVLICPNVPFCKPEFIIKSNYFQKGECFLDDFEALVREIDFRSLVFPNHLKSIRANARTSISRPSASKWPATA